ncbi:hypothetical protein A9Q84_21265 [Halobacteriovorax marinus]|uniref:Inositol monophosphatase n=1 Tax=Halobacteriovorax marinus TaxID=97084 RepID=A0A1Y5F283_9BACT|nr:hypothetical protein A9Q84_21265 [Halobacteriovorax marinus]
MLSDEKLDILRKGVSEIVKKRVNPLSLSDSLKISQKSDLSIVTIVDTEISDFIHFQLSALIKTQGFHFFSEEDPQSFGFPSIILDPIDGTRELAKGLGECVVSLAIMQTASTGSAWIYNPFTGFEITSGQPFVDAVTFNEDRLFGYVSRSDMKKGLLSHIEDVEGVHVEPRGSIAFKLALLASGACDFVYSKTPKNVWDIAAGTLLCWERGFKLFQGDTEIVSLDCERVSGELIWCREKDFERLRNSLVN